MVESVSREDPDYPEQLKGIKGAPDLLYFIGDLGLCRMPCAAIVGSRKCTTYGKWAAAQLARSAANAGIAVISGMALGIDTAAHRGALESGGKTIAVLGGGVDVCYPPSNRQLYEEIMDKGLLLAEQPPGQAPLPGMFPARNRIISGLSRTVVVVEAGSHSGSLITAELALHQNREVCAVPGNINCITSFGANKLIQDGATPIVVPSDLPQIMGISDPSMIRRMEEERGKGEICLSETERGILEILKDGREYTRSELCSALQMDAKKMGAMVTILEMKGFLQTDLGKIYIAKK